MSTRCPEGGGVLTATAVPVSLETSKARPVFSEEGSYPVTVSISETGEPATAITVSDTQSVTEPAVLGSSATLVSVAEGDATANVVVATFTHASGVEPTSAFNATINWGDGTTSPGTITQSGTTYSVTGSPC